MWNPFKKQAAPDPPAAPSQSQEMPDNAPLIALIQRMKLDTLMGDMRPMHRAIIESELLVPLLEPPTQTPQGLRMRYMTFETPGFGPASTLAVFTDVERMRSFFANAPDLSAQVGFGFWSGKGACEAAMDAELPLLAINPASDAHYAMPPHVYRALAFGYVPGSVAAPDIREGQIVIARPMSGMPSEPELQAWREVLAQHGALAAYWFNVLLDDVKELRYAIGVECAPERFEAIESGLIGAWLGIWPVNTPLYVQHLGPDTESEAIRGGGAPIFP